jgi:external thioesterase TEII
MYHLTVSLLDPMENWRLGDPVVLFGHSMGGMIVYRLTQKLERLGIFPEAVIISAVQPPHISREAMSQLDDEAFLDYVLGMGGIPSELTKDREIMQFFLPSFRADFKALETFKHTDYTMLRSPVHIFNGVQDAKCMKDALGWSKWAYRTSFHTFRGGHMFLLSEVEAVAQAIKSVVSLESAKQLIQV